MVKIMWAYRDSDNYVVGGELYHYGVLGMKWGVRRVNRLNNKRDRLLVKEQKWQKKYDKYNAKLHRPVSMKSQAKAAKYQVKLNRAETRAAWARKRQAMGLKISEGQRKRIARAEKYKSKVAQYSGKNSKLQEKLAKSDYKLSKIRRRIDRIDKKLTIAEAKARGSQIKKWTPGQYTRSLNNLDKVHATNLNTMSKYKNKDVSKYEYAKYGAKNYKKDVDIAIKSAKESGYLVETTPTQRKGRIYDPAYGFQFKRNKVSGKKYKVKKR